MPIEICPHEQCTGCEVCASVCPKQAIQMTDDGHGFLYPRIHQSRCVDCGLCISHCHICNPSEQNRLSATIYGAQSKNDLVRKMASSGGVVPTFAASFLKKNDGVAGAVFDPQFNVYEDICFSEREYAEKGFSRSKYVQSRTGDCFIRVKDALGKGKRVLFIGTPCQVSAIRTFTGSPKGLYTVDFVCHGTPSPKVFQEYLKDQKRKFGADIAAVDFRIKKPSWSVSSIRLKFENGKQYVGNMLKDPYCIAFTQNIILRECCYQCKYASPNRSGDITVCDFWGYKDKNDGLVTDGKGTSAVIINNEKGQQLFDSVKDEFRFAKRSFDEISSSNEQLVRSNTAPTCRNQFWHDFDNRTDFDELQRKYFSPLTDRMSKKDYMLLAYGNSWFMRSIVRFYLGMKKRIKR